MTDRAQALLDSLVGEWRGSGTVETPTTPSTAFDEVIRFSRRNATSIDYWQRAEGSDGTLLHNEVGVWRLGSPGRLELSIALAGSTEISEGEVAADGSFASESTAVSRAATSLNFMGARRRYRLTGNELDYDVDLASVHFPMSFHLRATLTRVGDAAD